MDELTTVTAGAPATTLLAQAGQAANRAATRHLFAEYRQRNAANTIRRQDTDLALFAQYLLDVADIPTGDLSGDPQAWAGVTWGLVAGFAKWQLDQGYSIGSINVRLSTVKTYCKLAAQAGTLDRAEYAMILTVGGYKHKEGKHVDKIRHAAGTPTRKSTKKAQAILLTQTQAERMKVILYGSYDMAVRAQALLDAGIGMSAIVQKPFQMSTLESEIHKVLAG